MPDHDVIVIGSGAAGLSAALEASNAGASVLVAEGAEVIGGSSRLSQGMVMAAGSRIQRAAGIDDTAEDLFHDYMSANRWSVEAALARRLTRDAGPAVDWLCDLGVRFIPEPYFSGDERKPRGHVMAGMAAEAIDVLGAELCAVARTWTLH